MAKILEFLTVNLAVKDLDAAVAKYRALGFHPHPPNHMPEPPAEITDVSVPTGNFGHVSLISPTAPGATVAKFIEKRGEGCYSIALRTDNLEELMAEWRAAGIEWILPKPYEFPAGTPCVHYLPDKLIANWVKPNSMFGVLFEAFELKGNIRPFGDS